MKSRDWPGRAESLRPARGFKLSWATRITLVRILLLVPFVICMVNLNDPTFSERAQTGLRYAAILLFVLMAVSDAVDGYLARHYQQITKLGTFLDPVADKLLMTSASVLLASEVGHVEGFRLPTTVVVAIVGKDVLIVLGFALVYLITSQVHVVPVFLGKLSTALQSVMVPAVLIAPELARVIPHYATALSVIWWSAAIVAILATVVYMRNGIRYIEHFEQSQGKDPATGSTNPNEQ